MNSESKIKKSLIEKIKQKKELAGLADSIVLETLETYLRKSRINLPTLTKPDKKILVKQIRAELRKYAGRFQKSWKQRETLLQQNKIKELLKTHTSTKERIDFYPKLKKLISKLQT